MIRAFAPMLRASGAGVVVSVSSISGFTGSGSSVAYCACKAALDTMTLSLARALGPEIRVMCVSPGAVATDFVAGRDRAALEKIAAGDAAQTHRRAGRCRRRGVGLRDAQGEHGRADHC